MPSSPPPIADLLARLERAFGRRDVLLIRATLGLLESALDRRDLVSELNRLMTLASRPEPPPSA